MKNITDSNKAKSIVLNVAVMESSFNMTRGGGGTKILRGGSENF